MNEFSESGISKATGKTTCIRCGKSIARGQPSPDLWPGDELEVDDNHRTIQRALRSGDLVRVKQPRARPTGQSLHLPNQRRARPSASGLTTWIGAPAA